MTLEDAYDVQRRWADARIAAGAKIVPATRMAATAAATTDLRIEFVWEFRRLWICGILSRYFY